MLFIALGRFCSAPAYTMMLMGNRRMGEYHEIGKHTGQCHEIPLVHPYSRDAKSMAHRANVIKNHVIANVIPFD